MCRTFSIALFLSLFLLTFTRAEEKPFLTSWRSEKRNQELVLRVKGENYHLRIGGGLIYYDGIVRRSTPEHPFRKFMEYQGARTLGIELGPQGVDYIRFNTGGDYYLTEIRQFGSVQWTSMHKAFADCGALTFAEYCDTPDLSLVSDMGAMFLNCRNFIADLSKWKVGTVTNMNSVFRGCPNFTSDLAEWDVSKVTNMGAMFAGCTRFESDLLDWKVDNVTRMDSMFRGCASFDSDLSLWNVAQVTDMAAMFRGCRNFYSDLSTWKVNNVTNMEGMFDGCLRFDADLSGWDVSKVTNMANMFRGCYKMNADLSKWNVSKVTNMAGMFAGCQNFNADISGWDVSHVTDLTDIFSGCRAFNQDLGHWNLKNCKSLSLADCAMSIENYSKSLLGWVSQDDKDIPKGFRLDATGLQFSHEARAAHSKLIKEFGWDIVGDISEGGERYPLYFGDWQLTSDNAENLQNELLQKGLLKQGKVSFDVSEKILTLENVELATTLRSEFQELYIKLIGKCRVERIQNPYAGVEYHSPNIYLGVGGGTIVFTGNTPKDLLQTKSIRCKKIDIHHCSIEVNSDTEKPLHALVWMVDNANVHIKCRGKITDVFHLGSENCAITSPADVSLKDTRDITNGGRELLPLYHLVNAAGKPITDELKIEPIGEVETMSLYIAGVQVTALNSQTLANITGVTLAPNGHLTYDPETHTLRMKNVTIDVQKEEKLHAIYNKKIEGLTLDLEGENQILAMASTLVSDPNLTLRGKGKLEIRSVKATALYLAKNTTLSIEEASILAAGVTGIEGGEKPLIEDMKRTLILKQATLTVSGSFAAIASLDNLTFDGCAITAPMGGHFDEAERAVMDGCGKQKLKDVQIIPQTTPTSVLLLCPATHEFTGFADRYEPTLLANVSWTAKSSADWLKCTPELGNGNTKLQIEVADNIAGQARFAHITFTDANNPAFSYVFSVTQRGKVIIPVRSIEFNRGGLSFEVGGSFTLQATIEPENATERTIVWTSEHPAIASVDNNGKVIAHAPGLTTIRASVGGRTAKCPVTVRMPIKTAIEDAFPTLTLMPNPFTKVLRITHNELNSIVFQLYNLHGVVLRTGVLGGEETLLDWEDLPAGLYCLQLWDGQGRCRLYRVVKE